MVIPLGLQAEAGAHAVERIFGDERHKAFPKHALDALIAEKIGHGELGAKFRRGFEICPGQAIIDVSADVLPNVMRDAAAQLIEPVRADVLDLRKRRARGLVTTRKYERCQNVFAGNAFRRSGDAGLVVLSIDAFEVVGGLGKARQKLLTKSAEIGHRQRPALGLGPRLEKVKDPLRHGSGDAHAVMRTTKQFSHVEPSFGGA